MHAINHGITALAIKRAAPNTPLAPLLISVQAMEMLWVGLNFAGIEWSVLDEGATSVAGVHLAHMPWSHSLVMTGLVAGVAFFIGQKFWRQWSIAIALATGVISHIVLDLLLHAPDIQIAPGMGDPKFGLGFYGSMPAIAWGLELAYGLIIWRMVGGGKGLLALIVLFNAAAFTSYMPFVGGEMQDTPMEFARFVAIQIAVSLPLIWVLAPKWMRGI